MYLCVFFPDFGGPGRSSVGTISKPYYKHGNKNKMYLILSADLHTGKATYSMSEMT